MAAYTVSDIQLSVSENPRGSIKNRNVKKSESSEGNYVRRNLKKRFGRKPRTRKSNKVLSEDAYEYEEGEDSDKSETDKRARLSTPALSNSICTLGLDMLDLAVESLTKGKSDNSQHTHSIEDPVICDIIDIQRGMRSRSVLKTLIAHRNANPSVKNRRYGGFSDTILNDIAPSCSGHSLQAKLRIVKKSGANKVHLSIILSI
jgi:hypothetical protein